MFRDFIWFMQNDKKIYLVVPAYNEEANIRKMLQSLVNQTYLPKKVVVVNDNSTDGTQKIIDEFCENYSFITSVTSQSSDKSLPGKKIINAFYKGFKQLDDAYDFIGKFDADIILPATYFERLIAISKNKKCGMLSGVLYIKKQNKWIFEDISNKKKVRGGVKLYSKNCFKDIGGLKNAMGWDTVDELLAKYYGWNICVDTNLHVKHLKPTGAKYDKSAKYKQGEAFYALRYGFIITVIAAAKLAFKKKSFMFFIYTLIGFLNAKKNGVSYLVTNEQGKFIRKLRWDGIKKKVFGGT